MNVYTATDTRPEIAEVWCRAMASTFAVPHATVVFYQDKAPCGCGEVRPIPKVGRAAMLLAQDHLIQDELPRLYIEEDMIPVRQWSLEDYPGQRLLAEGNPGRPWPSFYLMRGPRFAPITMVPMRFIRDGGCPDWLPADLCEPALRANAKVLGQHFLHLDKMYRPNVPEAAEKNKLLAVLRERYADAPPAQGLGDMVATGLAAVGITPARVSAALGVKDCGCKKRKEQLNELGRKFGIG